jgi:hypothetical protein
MNGNESIHILAGRIHGKVSDQSAEGPGNG